MRCGGNVKIYFITAWLRVDMEDKGCIQSLSRGQAGLWSERGESWAQYLLTLKSISSLSRGQNNLHWQKHSSLQKPMPKDGSFRTSSERWWFSSLTTWGMLTTDKLQKPQLSENGPIPWKHLCSQTVNDRGGNALQPSQRYFICWVCVSGSVPGGHGHLLSCDPVTKRLSVSPSGF